MLGSSTTTVPGRVLLQKPRVRPGLFRTRRPDTHSHTLLQGVFKERDEGKISGPFAAPAHWNVRTVPLPPHLRSSVDVPQPLLPWDRPQAAAAVAIVTEGSQGKSRSAVVKTGGGLFTMPRRRRGVARAITLSI